MSFLASMIGSGAGVIAIAVAVLLTRHYHHLPATVHPWVERGLIILMYAGGSAVAVTQLGQWADSAIQWAAGFLGGFSAGLPRAGLVIVCLAALASVAVDLFVSPGSRSAYLAAVLPVILALAAGGILHQIYVTTTVPGQALASALSSWIGG